MLDYLKNLWYSLLSILSIHKFEKNTLEYIEEVAEEVEETANEVSDFADKKISTINKKLRNGRKLTCSEVVEIIRMHGNKDFTNKELAKKYGVSTSTISRIVTRKSYKQCC